MDFYLVVHVPTGPSVAEEAIRLLCAALSSHVDLSLLPAHASALALVVSKVTRQSVTLSLSSPRTVLRLLYALTPRTSLAEQCEWEAQFSANSLPELREAAQRVSLRSRQQRLLTRLDSLREKLGGAKDEEKKTEQNTEKAELEEVKEVERSNWNYSEQTERVKVALESDGIAYECVRTGDNYYDVPLAARARYLHCQVSQLCKMVFLHNDRRKGETKGPDYLAVIVQYDTAKGFNTKKLNVWYR
jgi:hypothetical protein